MTNTDNDKFARALAFKPLVQRAGYAEVSAEISPETLNGVGIAHGGFLFSLSDYASALAANTPERLAISSGASIDYIEPVPAGASIVAVASVDAENAKSGVYKVVITDSRREKIFAVFRGRLIYKKPL